MLKRSGTRLLRLYAKTIPRTMAAFPPPGDAPVKILIQSMGGIGNTLMATPLIAETRRLYPNARIDVLTTPGAAQVLSTNPHATNIIADQDGSDHSQARYWRMNARLHATRYDAALLALNAVTFRFAVRAVWARIPRRVIHAYAFYPHDDYTPAFTHRVPRPEERHDVLCNLDLLAALSGAKTQAGGLVIAVPEAARADARTRLIEAGWRPGRKTVALCPGSSGWMSFKRWPLESYVQLAKDLLASYDDLNLVVFSGPDEADEVPVWQREIRASNFTLVRGLSLTTYAGAIEFCDVVVTNDSLPMHMSAALQRPLVALFGPTHPAHTGPWNCPATVLTPDVDFAPYFRIPYPLDPSQFPECMLLISVASVGDAVARHLAAAL